MISSHPVCLFVSVLLVTVLALGCGGSGPQGERIPVHGQVTVDGKPVQEGTVRFVPVGEESGPRRASAETLVLGGEYRVETGGGLREGDYRVEVEVRKKTGKKITIMDPLEAVPVEVDEEVLVSAGEYAGEDSPLTYTAQAGSDSRFDIDVPRK